MVFKLHLKDLFVNKVKKMVLFKQNLLQKPKTGFNKKKSKQK